MQTKTNLSCLFTPNLSKGRLLPILSLVTCYLLLATLLPPPAHAQIPTWVGNSACDDSRGGPVVYDSGNGDVATIKGFECIVSNILNVAITLIGLGIFAMLIIGSYQMITSGGDPKAVEAAKATITYAVMGLVIAILAWFIIFAIATLTGANTGAFNILDFSTNTY